MITVETRNSLYNARHNYEAALNRKSGVGASRESLKNVLFNHYQDLIGLALGTKEMVDSQAVKGLEAKIKNLEETVVSLNIALEESDKENNDIRKELRQLRKRVKANGKEPSE